MSGHIGVVHRDREKRNFLIGFSAHPNSQRFILNDFEVKFSTFQNIKSSAVRVGEMPGFVDDHCQKFIQIVLAGQGTSDFHQLCELIQQKQFFICGRTRNGIFF